MCPDGFITKAGLTVILEKKQMPKKIQTYSLLPRHTEKMESRPYYNGNPNNR